MTAAREFFLSDHARVARGLPGSGLPWLARQRAAALDLFAQRGLPTRHDEDWKYTSLAALDRQAFLALPDNDPDEKLAIALLRELAIEEGHLLVFHNGRFAASLSSPGNLPSGVTLASLGNALARSPDALEPYLASGDSATVFGALNAAFMTDGAYLRLRRGSMLEKPVHLVFLATSAGGASHIRNLVVAEEGSHATVIEHYAGIEGEAYLTNAVTNIVAENDAVVEHHKLQQESTAAIHIAGIHAIQQRDSRLASHNFSMGSALARNDITTSFGASGCEAVLNGLYLAARNQHVDNHTCIDHRQPNGTSREYYRGVLDGASHAVFNGRVVVQPGAQKTNAYQANHNLLLSREAEVDTKPQLEIHADDVKCNHGATIGQLDETQLFYLRSRGIEEAMARMLLVHAFAHGVIERIRIASLRGRLERILLARLPQAELMGERP